MRILLSPAKTLDFNTAAPTQAYTQPEHLEHSAQLIKIARQLSPQAIAELMGVSDAIAILNVGRFAAWHTPFDTSNAKQALFAFMGDVYEGLDAYQFSQAQIEFAQQHLRILSGLYGLLRPLDLIQAYRLEMGTRLQNPKGKNLYAFWGDHLTSCLKKEMQEDPQPWVLNLASDEYFKSIQAKQLSAPVISPVFQDYKNGQYKIISFYAKRARGLMARYMIENSLKNPEDVLGFNFEGYRYIPQESTATHPIFRRDAV